MGKHGRRKTFPAILGGFVLVGAGIVVQQVLSKTTDAGISRIEGKVGGGPSLQATPSWPLLTGCDGATETATSTQQPAQVTIGLTADQDVRQVMIKHGGGAWRSGTLTLKLEAPKSQTLFITGIQPHVFKELTPPAWKYTPLGGCGDAYARIFYLDLDKPRPYLKDAGIQGDKNMAPPFGKAFTVSPTDPALIQINAFACTRSVEFGLTVYYSMGGRAATVDVGTRQAPFRLFAGRAPLTYARLGGTTPHLTAFTEVDRPCRAPS